MASVLHRRLAITCSTAGLHCRPLDDDLSSFEGPAVRLTYGKKPKLELVEYKEEAEVVLVVDGIAGLLQGPGKSASLKFSDDEATAD